MKYPLDERATDDTRRAMSAHLEALHRADAATMVVVTWWAGDGPIMEREFPAHLMFDVPAAPAGATHLTIEERKL